MPDSPAVKLWRDKFRLNLSASWKRDVEKTITDLKLWKSILDNWFYYDASGKKRTKHPGIKQLLDEYDRRQFDAIQSQGNGVHSTEGISERPQRVLPELELPAFLERTGGWSG